MRNLSKLVYTWFVLQSAAVWHSPPFLVRLANSLILFNVLWALTDSLCASFSSLCLAAKIVFLKLEPSKSSKVIFVLAFTPLLLLNCKRLSYYPALYSFIYLLVNIFQRVCRSPSVFSVQKWMSWWREKGCWNRSFKIVWL